MSNPTPEEIERLVERLREEPDTMAWPTIRRRMRDAADALAVLRARADAPAESGETLEAFVEWEDLTTRAMLAEARAEAAERKLEAVVKAGEPFVAFITPIPFNMPDDIPMTKGSPLARKQITFGDFRALSAAISAAKGEGEA